jgi:hypothetical protein
MRALWGIYDDSHRILRRRSRTDRFLQNAIENKYDFEFVTYVFGEDNYKFLLSKGIKNCILIDKNPAPFDLLKEQYRHKLEAIRYAIEEDKYDEMIHLDWDCYPVKKLPTNFWDIMGKKEAFQSCLFRFKHLKCPWRTIDRTIVPNGGFIYIRNKEYPARIIKIWEDKLRGPSAEPPFAMLVDELMGGWQGVDKYFDLYESDFCKIRKGSPHTKENLAKKNVCFEHHYGY